MPTLADRRDRRLDLFRGLGMVVILIAHIPRNGWADWIPARFGFSDATEIFVFCSGLASALAFGPVYDRAGWRLGSARILHRLWQVYRAHIGVFVATVAVLAAIEQRFGFSILAHELNLAHLLSEPGRMLAGLVTLSYVPNYFDILPMYFVILALIPPVMALASVDRRLAAAGVILLWCAARLGLLELPAEPWSARAWFFNPFSWQLLFFLGFAFGRGWLPPPPADRRVAGLALLGLIAAAPFSCQYGFSCHAGWGYVSALGDIHAALGEWLDKTHLGALRSAHFLCLAYLAFVWSGPAGRRLGHAGLVPIETIGRQTLAVFLVGLVLAQVVGVLLALAEARLWFGPYLLAEAAGNLVGIALLWLTAIAAEWFRSSPWRKPKEEAGLARGAGLRHAGRALRNG